MKKFMFLPAFLFLVPALTAAQEAGDQLKITASVMPEQVFAGQPVEYRIDIEGEKLSGLEVELPEPGKIYPAPEKDSSQAAREQEVPDRDPVPLFVIESSAENSGPAVSHQTAEKRSFVIKTSCYRPGTWKLPELKITGMDGIPAGYKIPEIRVQAVNTDGSFAEIEQPLMPGNDYTRLVLLILAAALLSVAAVLLIRHFMNKRKNLSVTEVHPLEDFLKEAEEIRAGRLAETVMPAEYCFDISMAFRRFLSSVLKADTMEMTTDEISRILKKKFHGNGDERQIMALFELWDLSKYAEFSPSADTMLAGHDTTVRTARRLWRDSGTETGQGSPAAQGEKR